ncbi:MAG: glycosyltransferase family 4 protein [candidate division Zixibacteria bacterium]|nr:glycosyltransferase family 4 protein [candidate division Zixibacteria bacterium]
MRILYLSFDSGIPFWGMKGASIHIREFTKALKEAGHKVTTAVARLGDSRRKTKDVYELPKMGIDFFHQEIPEQFHLLAETRAFARNFGLKKLLKKIPAKKFDLIYERYSLFGIAGLSWAKDNKFPFVLEVNSPMVEEAKTHRQLMLEPLAKAVEGYLFSNAGHLVAVSEAVKEYIHSVAPSASVTVVPNGVDIRPFLAVRAANGAPGKHGEGKFTVGFVGSLKPWHGLEFLLEAFRRLPEDQNFELKIVGDGPLRPSLEKLAHKLGIHSRVAFTGVIDFEEIPRTLRTLDALVAPYPHMDGFYFSPLKIFEYMAAGRPIVASRIGQVAEILENEKNALLVPPEDPEALASALFRLKSDRTLGEKLGKQAQKMVKVKHTWKNRLHTIQEIFESLMDKK